MSEPKGFGFEIEQRGPCGRARTGRVHTAHGSFATPAFMPVGTQATVKGLLPEQVAATGAEIILANTYHLHLRPGEEAVRSFGGLHDFMGWKGPILTDSGGFQVWSLTDLRTITDEGVRFKSHIDGSPHLLSPRTAMEIQIALGSDIIMSFDECMPYPIEREKAELSLARTHLWEKETLGYHPRDGRALFAIIQGGVFDDLRLKSAEFLLGLPFDGYAMGGLFIGELRDDSMAMLDLIGGIVPEHFPRYVMGVGTPLEILDAVARGWDMFDCVLPTRNARHGTAMTFAGPLKIKNSGYRLDAQVLEPGCPCLACAGGMSRGYLRHLIVAGEILGMTLMSHHNLSFMQRLMQAIRRALVEGRLPELRAELERGWKRLPSA